MDKLNGLSEKLTSLISANMYDFIDNSMEFDGITEKINLFRVSGAISIQKVTGIVETQLSGDIGYGYIDFCDDVDDLNITASPGTLFNNLPVDTYIHRIDGCLTKIKIEDSSTIHLYENLTRFDTSPKFEIIAKSNCPCYIRFCHSGIGTSGKIRWRIVWMPLTKYSKIEAVAE